MLVTDVGDEMFWSQVYGVGDRLDKITNITDKSRKHNDFVTHTLNRSP